MKTADTQLAPTPQVLEPCELTSLNVSDLDIHQLEQRMEMASLFDPGCYINFTCSANCSANLDQGGDTSP